MDYYNDNDRYCAAWLSNLVRAGIIPRGTVDDRDIRDVRSGDLAGYRRVHLFAGIGGWAEALRLAQWPEESEVWTLSCPCQPFSNAGKRRGEADNRHLWPEARRLISECRPPVVFGEQVASKDGREWFSRVRADLEALGYAVGAADLCAAGIGAPHIRQRLWFGAVRRDFCESSVADAHGRSPGAERLQRGGEHGQFTPDGRAGPVGNANIAGSQGWRAYVGEHADQRNSRAAGLSGGFWSGAEWIVCHDGKARRIEPRICPLAHGVSGRVVVRRTVQQGQSPSEEEEHWYNRIGAIRGYGNAIVPQVGAQFAVAFREAVRQLRPRPRLAIRPITLAEAKDFILRMHRHNKPPVGHKFSIGVCRGDELVGVAVAGRPVARHLDDGFTIEVNRTCTDGTRNANSMLYGAIWRAAKAMGYRRCITYTQRDESGASLRAAGWTRVADLRPRRSWRNSTRDPKRVAKCDPDAHEFIARVRWEISCGGYVQCN